MQELLRSSTAMSIQLLLLATSLSRRLRKACWSFHCMIVSDWPLLFYYFESFSRHLDFAVDPWSRVLWELPHPSLVHFLGCGHCRNECPLLSQVKQSFFSRSFSAEYCTTPKRVTVLASYHWFSLLSLVTAFPWLLVVAAKTLILVWVLVTLLTGNSLDLGLLGAAFILLCASALANRWNESK